MLRINNCKFEKTIIIIISAIGIILPLIQFIYNRSLCGDEVWLSLNIINRNHYELLKPLDYAQSAPILFLQIEKIFSELIPNSEFGLKTFPFICHLLSLFLFNRIIKIVFKNFSTIIFALSLFIFNMTIIIYSNEVKQYMTDILIVMTVYYLILKNYNNDNNKYTFLIIVGAISIFLSNAAPIILFTTGIYLIHDYYTHKTKKIKNLVYVFAVWAISFFLYYFLFIHYNPTKNIMIDIWEGSFIANNPFDIAFYKFLLQKGSSLLLFLFPFGGLGEWLIILMLTGIISLIKKRRTDIIILTITPIVLTFILSSFKLYPIVPRILLFFVPILIIIFSFGFDYLINIFFGFLKIRNKTIRFVSIPIIVLMLGYFCFLNSVGSYPYKRSEVKNSIRDTEQHIGKNDKIYLSFYFHFPYQYYREISFMNIDNRTIIGSSLYQRNLNEYYNELNSLEGRVWFMFIREFHTNYDNKTIVLNYLETKGKMAIREFHTNHSSVFVYDL